MGYLNYLPKFNYTLGGVVARVSDLFRRVSFTQKTLNESKNWKEYFSNQYGKPDQIAESQLGEFNYYWQILMANNITDESGFPDNLIQYKNHIQYLENGKSLFFESFFGTEPRVGDVVYLVDAGGSEPDTDSGGIVYDYDKLLRKIDVSDTFGTAFSQGVTAALYGNNDAGEFVEKGRLLIKKFVSIAGSVDYFVDNNGRIASPYLIPDVSGVGGTYTDPVGITLQDGSLLHEYVIDGTLPANFGFVTELQSYEKEQNKKKQLKLPNIGLTDKISAETKSLLSDGIQGQRVSISGIFSVGSTNTDTING